MSSSRKLFAFYCGVILVLGSAQAQTAATSQPGVTLEAVTGFKPRHDGIDIQTGAIQSGSASLSITALRDDILRVRIAPGNTLPEDASWAVLPGPRGKSVDVQPLQDAASVGFRTAAVEVRVERIGLQAPRALDAHGLDVIIAVAADIENDRRIRRQGKRRKAG